MNRQSFVASTSSVEINGWRMNYFDKGPRDATPVLLLHGNPSWGFIWRDCIPPLLSAGLRVIVPDQIGFGLSEHPHSAAAHSLENHAANLVALIDKLELKNIFFVCQDWGGPTGLAALLARDNCSSAIAVMSTWAWQNPSAKFHNQILPWRTMHAPLVGPYILGRKKAFPGRGMYLSVVDRKKFLSDTMQHYEDVIPDTDDRRLTWQWPRSIPINASTDIAKNFFQRLEEGVKGLKLPSLIIWGKEDKVFEPEVFAKKWLEIWPHSEGIHFVTGDHFLQEDSGNEIGFILAEFATQLGLTAGQTA